MTKDDEKKTKKKKTLKFDVLNYNCNFRVLTLPQHIQFDFDE